MGFNVPGGGSGDPLALGIAESWGNLGQQGSAISPAAANRAFFSRAVSAGYCAKIRIGVGAPQVGNVDVGVYSPAGSGLSAVPATLKGHSGSTPVPPAGVLDLPMLIPFPIALGDFFAIVGDDATQTFNSGTPTQTTLQAGLAYMRDGSFPLPATISSGLVVGAYRYFTMIALPS